MYSFCYSKMLIIIKCFLITRKLIKLFYDGFTVSLPFWYTTALIKTSFLYRGFSKKLDEFITNPTYDSLSSCLIIKHDLALAEFLHVSQQNIWHPCFQIYNKDPKLYVVSHLTKYLKRTKNYSDTDKLL